MAHLLCSVGFDKRSMSCIHLYNIMQNSFTALKIPYAPSMHPCLLLKAKSLAIIDIFTVSTVVYFPELNFSD